LFDSVQRALKYPPNEAVSNFPAWKLQMAGGMALSVLIFGSAWLALRRRPWTPRLASWVAVGISATTAGILLGVASDKMLYESYGFGGWLGWGSLLTAAIVSPLFCANALMSGRSLPTFLELLGPRDGRTGSFLTIILGAALLVTTLIGTETALGFVFDPRYRDFPFAALTMAVVPFALLMLLNRPQEGARPTAESVFAGVLAAAVVYTVFNEGAENWQSLWTCAMYFLLAVTLWRARGVQIPK
jgi:glucan 1,3-beta-glucosidase